MVNTPSRITSWRAIEALRAGLPVLTPPHKSARDLIRDSYGRIAAATPQSLAETLTALITSKEALQRMGREALTFGQTLSFSHAANKLLRILKQIPSPAEETES